MVLNYPPDSHTTRNSDGAVETAMTIPLSRRSLVTEPARDSEFTPLFNYVLAEEDLERVPTGYFIKSDVLMRKRRHPHIVGSEDWSVVHQVILPKKYRREVMKTVPKIPLRGHLGVTKTCDKVTKHFHSPGVRKNVSEYCRTCHACQVVGKPN